MEDSKAQKKIISLGEAIVNELELDPGIDTLSKWMAHYVAEKIMDLQTLTGKNKSKAEKECAQIILKLWDQRWSIPYEKPFLKDFESLFETLHQLSPSTKHSFFIPKIVQTEIRTESRKKRPGTTENYFKIALQVDNLAKNFIFDLLRMGVSKLSLDNEREELIRSSLDVLNYPDIKVIKLISEYDKKETLEDQATKEQEKRKATLQKKIIEIEALMDIQEDILKTYRKELSEI